MLNITTPLLDTNPEKTIIESSLLYYLQQLGHGNYLDVHQKMNG